MPFKPSLAVVGGTDSAQPVQPQQSGQADTGHAATPVRRAREEILSDWMATHTRVLGLWLDRLIEEGDEGNSSR